MSITKKTKSIIYYTLLLLLAFIVIIILFINFNLFVLAGCAVLGSVLLHKNKNLSHLSFFTSFIVLITSAFNTGAENLIWTILPITLVSGIFSLMMIGHWFLVDPTITRIGMKNIARSSIFIAVVLCLLLLF